MLRSLHYVGPVAPPQSKKSCGRDLLHDDDDWRASQYLLLLSLILLCFCFCFLFCYCFTSRDTRTWGCVAPAVQVNCCFYIVVFSFHRASCIVLVPPGRRASSSGASCIIVRTSGHQASSSGSSWRRAWHQALASGAAAQVNCCFSFSISLIFFFIDSPSSTILFLCSGDSFFFILHRLILIIVVRFLLQRPALSSGSLGIQPWPPVRWSSSLGIDAPWHR